ncbi:MAG: hypothetical protein D4R81_08105 [Nitrospiraceae bacterium]|nr:MAG: hypothetical protein D4R81_08105 [Nitrospiraceae bacterium]
MDLSRQIETLNLLVDAFSQTCYDVVITYGARAQTAYRHKTYSITRETTGIFLPDGALTAYVMESYERGYLTILLADSYLRAKKPDDAKVELRRLDQELFAPLYNYGEDPVNLLLSAVLWEQLGDPGEARVDWLRLRDQVGALKGLEPDIRSFAERQLTRIDRGETVQPAWQIYGLGTLPGVEWDLKFTGSSNGYFRVRPNAGFLPACASDTGLRIPTQHWFEKIAVRHSHAYHPLLNVQSWIRLPIGIVYSLVPVAAGAGVAVGGCVTDAAGKGNGQLCELSIRGGIALMRQAPKVLKGALEPDFRHWEHMPSAFVVTRASHLREEPCARDLPDRDLAQAVKF